MRFYLESVLKEVNDEVSNTRALHKESTNLYINVRKIREYYMIDTLIGMGVILILLEISFWVVVILVGYRFKNKLFRTKLKDIPREIKNSPPLRAPEGTLNEGRLH